MGAAADACAASITATDRLAATLKKSKSPRVRSADERVLIKATSHAWFERHRREIVAAGAGGLAAIDDNFSQMLAWAEQSITRSRYQSRIRDVKAALVRLRGELLLAESNKAPTTAVAAPDFSRLVGDALMREHVRERWRETLLCLDAGASLAATVMMGGLLEGLLIARFSHDADKTAIFALACIPKDGKTGKAVPAQEWMLRTWLDVARERQWISRAGGQVGGVVMEYRNLIHPQKQHRTGIAVTAADARMLWATFAAICEELAHIP